MRISNNMLLNNYLTSLNQSLARQSEIQQKLSDGKDLHKPSDDPVRTIRALKFHTELAGNEQFTQHVKDAVSWMEQTDQSLQDMGKVIQRAKELTIQAVGPNDTTAYQAIGKEIDELINQAVSLANTQVGDRYLFSGQKDKNQPVVRTKDAAGNDQFVYNGDNNKISMVLQNGGANPTQDSVNLTAPEIFGPNMELLYNLSKIKNELVSGTPNLQNISEANPIYVTQSNAVGGSASVTKTSTPLNGGPYACQVRLNTLGAGGVPATVDYSTDGGTTWNTGVATPGGTLTIPMGAAANLATISINGNAANAAGDTYNFNIGSYMGNLDSDYNRLLSQHTQMGSRMSMYNMAESMLENNSTTITDNLSANEDLDMPKAIIDFKNSENVYNAALAVGAKILPQSLVDFLK
ncbi:flagellar hook-associated protein FlgL [Azotosporobacter soli]|uniref:flagellar hook-associated protein FlgL n=1 Tax=Azotosporobacter soli TaxID=3055040 RepID=UPI0031FF2169